MEQEKQMNNQDQQQNNNNTENLNLEDIMNQQDQEEVQVGISEFLNPGQKIIGIVKYRISDFIVNEIDRTSKKVIMFNKEDTQKFKKLQEQKAQMLLEKQKPREKVERAIQDEDIEQFKKLFGEPNYELISRFYEDWVNGEKKTFFEFEVPAPQEKQQRTELHEFVREKVPFFDSQTQGDKIVLKFTKNLAKKSKYRSKQKNAKEENFSFTLFKTNIDTNTAIGNLAQFLRIQPNFFSTAGLKDKRGFTTQRVTVNHQKLGLDDFIKNINNYKSEHIFTSDYQVVPEPMRMGELYGNRFSIAIRFVGEPSEEILKTNVDSLSREGFINYYGMQRFGAGEIKSWTIGLHMLKKEFQKAADKILCGNGLTYQLILDEYKQTNDSDKALQLLPKHLKRERDMIVFYKKNGSNAHLQCLQSLPKNVRDLYPHAYQSYVWNKLASLRIQTFGKKLVIGDIVEKYISAQQQEQQNSENENNDEDDYKGINQIATEYITEQNIDQYKFSDLLIPIIGAELQLDFEKYNMSKQLIEILEEDGMSFEILQQSHKHFFLTGGYRKLIFEAENVESKIIRFNDLNADFLTPFYHEEEDTNVIDGKYSALVLRFTLQKGAYATMLMRELTKVSSSYQYQQLLNKKYEQLDQEVEKSNSSNKQMQE